MKTFVPLSKLAQELRLTNLTPEVSMDEVEITNPEINRPALQLAGYYEHFANERVQIIGYVEYSYLMQLEKEKLLETYENFISQGIPCVIFTTLTVPSRDMLDIAAKYKVPTLSTARTTSAFMAECIRWLGVELAPSITIHGVLVDVYGEGVLIMGESGIGKSEAALELVRRGHRLVSDDAVVIRKVSDIALVGSAPDVTKHMIELRGIGIIDVRMLYGVEHVKESQPIDMVIKLVDWDKNREAERSGAPEGYTEYNRMGLVDDYIEFLGNKVVCHSIPIRPGRNLAVIVETAAINHRQKSMGYNAAEELSRRVQENLTHKRGI